LPLNVICMVLTVVWEDYYELLNIELFFNANDLKVS
jgi:hypothetical protein